ncbi:MAG: hypothetical protein V4727_06295 [Verrucomicrobiota bacterium]
MARLLIFIAVIPIIITLLVRWWLGIRLLKSSAELSCSCDLEKWKHTFGEQHLPVSSPGTQIMFAELLRKSALADWRERDRKLAISREGTRRFGMAVPPLTAMIVILGIVVGRVTPSFGIAIFLLATAFSAVIAYLSIAPEINAILTTARKLRTSGIFHRRDDEDAVIQAAVAIAWKEAAPPIFNLLQH